jgi:CHAT domain-containing protein
LGTCQLLYATGELPVAIDAHRCAINPLQSVRHALGAVYGRTSAAFRAAAEPVYFGLVDLLLKRAATLSDGALIKTHLRATRDAVECLKAAELVDYFRDEYVTRDNTTELEVGSKTAAVVYPIMLSDRLELLIAFPSGLQRFTVSVGAAPFTGTVRNCHRFVQSHTTRPVVSVDGGELCTGL